MKILIKNGRVIDPGQSLDEINDVLIVDGKIEAIKKNITEQVDQIYEAKGKIVAPGLIDMHTHLRDPGFEYKETIETGARAAVYGGFTSIFAMPNTNPPYDNRSVVEYVFNSAKKAGWANVIPIGSITKGRAGKEISEMAELKDAGCLSLSDDGDSVPDAQLLRRAMEYASMLDLLIVEHCEDKNLTAQGVMYEGYWSTVLGLNPISAESESVIVDRDIQIAELTGTRLHIAHISSARSIDFLRKGKARGVQVTAEATPHHFSLTDESVKNYDTNFKMKPPLCSEEDVSAVKEALKDGTIDAIATDHAPHDRLEKEREFDYAPFGVIGLETALSLAVTQLLDAGILDWPGIIRKMSYNPCKILKYNRGTLKPGSIADIVVIDPDKKWIYTKDQIKSKSKNSPFIGWEMRAKPEYVFINGEICKLENE